MSKKPSPQMSLIQSLMWIVGSTFVISGSFQLSISHFFQKHTKQSQNAFNTICTLIQTGPQKEALRSEYLCQLMELSRDKPTEKGSFDPHLAEARLLSSPLIQEAHVKVIKPSCVYVDYTVRQPIATILDFENLAVDKAGYLLPLYPFFPPKNLPQIFLGAEDFPEYIDNVLLIDWGHPIRGVLPEIAFDILHKLQPISKDLFNIERIDVSKALDPSLGKREIVVILKNELYPGSVQEPVFCLHYLRLSTKFYSKELGDYLELRKKILSEDLKSLNESHHGELKAPLEKVIDLRINQLAFINDIDHL